MRSKRGGIMNQMIVQIILVGLILAIFVFATSGKINARGVRQQVLEKQTALLIDSAVPGMDFEIARQNLNGVVQSMELKEGKVFVGVDGLGSVNGYPYFTKYSVQVFEREDKFVVSVR